MCALAGMSVSLFMEGALEILSFCTVLQCRHSWQVCGPEGGDQRQWSWYHSYCSVDFFKLL